MATFFDFIWGRSLARQIGEKPCLLLLVLLFCGALSETRAQHMAQIASVQTLTEDNVLFRIKPRKNNFDPGEAILIDYQIENKNKRSVYSIFESKIYLPKAEMRWLLKTSPPAKGNPNEFIDYKLVKIAAGNTLNGTLVINNDQIARDIEYDAETWEVQLGFSYSFYASVMKNCSSKYKLPCLTELFQKSKNLSMGNLVIQIKNR
ncbi:MAG TPA: hypothetical protein PKC65_15930 [Pyrinomonadaceae bacterium]|nr:hypothetical protein [Pyrinomonadaceae bacterium]